MAVNGISVGIKEGECFGWLGLNGAGKSTTFKMLTNQITPSSGYFKLHQNFSNCTIGYCPQNDALDDYVSVKDTLYIYALLKGISKLQIPEEIETYLNKLGLSRYKDVLTKNLSGGNKRKLCTAIAFLGNPKLIYLDEPTSGMDAVAKRLVWSLIKLKVHKGTSVILTSHSMEECEVLCNRLAIMAYGNFQCFGTPSQLKHKFGKGYSVTIVFEKLAFVSSGVEYIKQNFDLQKDEIMPSDKNHINNSSFNLSMIMSSSPIKVYNTTVTFRPEEKKVSKVFAHILKIKKKLKIQDFFIQHATLDQVFINFSQSQPNNNNNNNGSSEIHQTHF